MCNGLSRAQNLGGAGPAAHVDARRARAELRQRLIAPTVKNALRIPFYRDHWRGYDWRGIESEADLVRLPVLTRSNLEQLGETFDYKEVPPYVRHTSGTSGAVAFRCTSSADAALVWRFYDGLQRGPDLAEPVPLLLCVDSSNHGDTIPMPGRCYVLSARGFSREIAAHVLQMLARKYAFPGVEARISGLICGTGFLKLLHVEAARAGADTRAFGLKTISVTGDHLERRWRNLIETIWNVVIVNRYSISEVFGGAIQERENGLYTFDPVVVPEIVDCWTHAPLDQGSGLLLLTELYPFSTFQPAIRYITGDLMEKVCGDGEAEPTYRFLGRWANAVRCERRRQIQIYPAPLAEALDAFPTLRRAKRFKSLELGAAEADLGPVLCEIESYPDGGPGRLTLRLAAKFSPACYPDAAETLVREAKAAVTAACPLLDGDRAPSFAIELASEDAPMRWIEAN